MIKYFYWVIFIEYLLCLRDYTRKSNISPLAPRMMSWKFLFPFSQQKRAKLREVPKSGARIWTQIWATSKCLLILLICTTLLSGTQRGSIERAHLFLNWSLEAFGGCVRFLSKEGRGKRQREDSCNVPHACLFLHTSKQHLWNTH